MMLKHGISNSQQKDGVRYTEIIVNVWYTHAIEYLIDEQINTVNFIK